jgi:hypothetical protein
MKSSPNWKTISCIFINGISMIHDIIVRRTEKDGIVEIAEQCSNCRMSFWRQINGGN